MDTRDSQTTSELTMPQANLPQSFCRAENVEKLAALARLQGHYYQPGQTSQQLKAIFEDLLEDLAHLTASEVQIACRRYRSDGENKFFPTSGQLLRAFDPPAKEAHFNLPKFTANMYERPEISHQGKLPSVAEVLRKHGQRAAAEAWEARGASRMKGGI